MLTREVAQGNIYASSLPNFNHRYLAEADSENESTSVRRSDSSDQIIQTRDSDPAVAKTSSDHSFTESQTEISWASAYKKSIPSNNRPSQKAIRIHTHATSEISRIADIIRTRLKQQEKPKKKSFIDFIMGKLTRSGSADDSCSVTSVDSSLSSPHKKLQYWEEGQKSPMKYVRSSLPNIYIDEFSHISPGENQSRLSEEVVKVLSHVLEDIEDGQYDDIEGKLDSVRHDVFGGIVYGMWNQLMNEETEWYRWG